MSALWRKQISGRRGISFLACTTIRGKGGSAEQRNQLLDAAAAWDLIFLQDDDFLADQSYLERTVEVFAQRPEVAGSTGRILQNGARGPGYSVAQARRFLLDASPNALLPGELTESTILADGCNMGFPHARAPQPRTSLR